MEYLIPHRGRRHHVNMLLLDDDNDKYNDEDVDATDRGTSKRHHVWVKNMSREWVWVCSFLTAHQHKKAI